MYVSLEGGPLLLRVITPRAIYRGPITTPFITSRGPRLVDVYTPKMLPFLPGKSTKFPRIWGVNLDFLTKKNGWCLVFSHLHTPHENWLLITNVWVNSMIHPRSLTARPWKMDGWKTILSYWVLLTFQGQTVKLRGSVMLGFLGVHLSTLWIEGFCG